MGSTATTLGFITYIFNTTHSPFNTGAVTIATLLVGMLLGPFLGILVKEKGLKFEIKESEASIQNVNPNFAGKNFLFTGTLKHFTREQIKEEIEKLGGKNLSSVSKNLDYLIVGEKAGSKLKKAQEIPTIKILTEEEFIELKDKFD